MKKKNIINGPQEVSRIILGCMRMPALSVKDAANMISCAVESGINFFDHATCYGEGEAERRFGDAFRMTGLKREDYSSRANADCIWTARNLTGAGTI